MSVQPDPYRQWLQIPGDRRPLNHYELLGLEPFEPDGQQIAEAFHKRFAMVRKYEVGTHGERAVQLLEELSQAYQCLSNPASKRHYDQQLRKERGEPSPRSPQEKGRAHGPAGSTTSRPETKPDDRAGVVDSRAAREVVRGESGGMTHPTAADYNAAIQNLDRLAGDEELRGGEVICNRLGLPMPYSGNVADVYKVRCARRTVAVKCFIRGAPGLRQRYREISEYLKQVRLPFMVDFDYVEQGLRINGNWHPVLKMHWVEGGLGLNEFVEQYLDRPKTLRQLLGLWVKLADRLRQARVAHADLQHGNVLLVPVADTGQLSLKLIDYDGMHVPSLAGIASGELGHPCYQHPQRLQEGTYSGKVDRFSHLVIYCAIESLLAGGRPLWERFNNQENLLFREADFADPGQSELFQELWSLQDPGARALVGHLLFATQQPLDQVPLLEEIVAGGQVRPLGFDQERKAAALLGAGRRVLPVTTVPTSPLAGVTSASSSQATSAPSLVQRPTSGPSSGMLPSWIQPGGPASRTVPQQAVEAPASSVSKPSSDMTPQRSMPNGTNEVVDTIWELVRQLDALLARLAGPEHHLIHQFFRVLVVIVASPIAAVVALPIAAAVFFFHLANSLRESALTLAQPTQPQAQSDSLALPLAIAPFDARQAAQYQQAWATHVGMAVELTNSIGMKLRLIPAGEFMMGSPDGEEDRDSDEGPQHRVRLTKPYYLGVYEVTQGEYERVMGTNPSRFSHTGSSRYRVAGQYTSHFPVESVSWEDAMEFCRKLSALPGEQSSGRVYRLPTEAEWEYACRAGTTTPFHFGSVLDGRHANCDGNYRYGTYSMGRYLERTSRVGSYPANGLGLYDMHGNVMEWCSDWYGRVYYGASAVEDPTGPATGSLRIFRGGCWFSPARLARSAIRYRVVPSFRDFILGFRLALSPSGE